MPTQEGMKIRTVAFSQNGNIPSRYTCEGEDVNPPLEILDVPEKTKSLALIMEDPDAPSGTFIHWVHWNFRPGDVIAEGSTPGVDGINSFGNLGYGGPCPPSGSHRYYFRAYALDRELDLLPGVDKKTLLKAMEGHVLETAEIMGRYQKKSAMANQG